ELSSFAVQAHLSCQFFFIITSHKHDLPFLFTYEPAYPRQIRPTGQSRTSLFSNMWQVLHAAHYA
ncbi:MAG: hypothetical protein LKI57_06025, partial [Acetobacter lovaniensis]|nr:hypothetical protein [Acetobacter lovaniensis]